MSNVRVKMLKGYRSFSKFLFIVVAVLLDILDDVSADGLVPEKSTEKSNVTKPLEEIPQYHFQYYVQDSDSGDYKTQEESRDGERVQGSYSVAEPNGDLRVVTYTADIKNGFKADVKFHPGGSPMAQRENKSNRTATPHRSSNYRSNFTPSKPRYMSSSVTRNPLSRTTNPHAAPVWYETVGNGGLKTVGLHDYTAKKPESKQLGSKEMIEKDSVVVEMHLNDDSLTDEIKIPEPQKIKAKRVNEAPSEVQNKVTEKIDTVTTPQSLPKLKIEQNSTPKPSMENTPSSTVSSNIEDVLKTSEVKPKTNYTTKSIEKAIHDKVKVEVEQIITSTLHQPTISAQEEVKKEALLADKDLRGIHNKDTVSNGESRSNTAPNVDKEELHISVHQNVRTDEAAKNRAQKKYSTLPRPLRLVEQVPVGNYQLQTLSEPVNVNPVENGNSYNKYNQNYNSDSNSYVGNSNYYYDPTLAASVSNYYGNQPVVTHINGNSLKPQSIYDQYPAESQQYAIGYEWIKMNPRMINSNGERYIVMDPDYSSTKTFFGYPRPTTLFHQLTKPKFKPQEVIKPQDNKYEFAKPQETAQPQENKYELNKPQDQLPASTVKEPVMIAQKNALHPQAITSQGMTTQSITAENSPKHDQQIPLYFKNQQTIQHEQPASPVTPKQNLTQKYLESLQAVPFPYPMDVVRVPAPVPSNGVIKQLPVIQPATINPIPAYAWPTGSLAINPAIAFILLPLQTAQDPPVQPIIVN